MSADDVGMQSSGQGMRRCEKFGGVSLEVEVYNTRGKAAPPLRSTDNSPRKAGFDTYIRVRIALVLNSDFPGQDKPCQDAKSVREEIQVVDKDSRCRKYLQFR